MKPSSKVIAGKNKSGGSKSVAAPITRMSVSDGRTERSVSVRKIDNGFIVSETTYGPKGQYKNTERFTDKAPVIDVAKAKK